MFRSLMESNNEVLLFSREDSESGISSDSSLCGNSSVSPPYANWINPRRDSRRDSSYSDESNVVDEGLQSRKFDLIYEFETGEKINGEPRKNSKSYCAKHREDLRFYCKNCLTKICLECSYKNHRYCRFEPLNGYTETLCHSVLDEDRSELTDLKARVIEIQKSFECKIESVKENIKNAADQIKSDVEERKNDLFRKLECVEKIKIDSWKRQMDVCDVLTNKLNKFPQRSKILNFREVNAFRKNMLSVIGNEFGYIEDENIGFNNEFFPNANFGKIKTSVSPKNSLLISQDVSYLNKFNCCIVVIKNHMDEIVTDADFSLTANLIDSNNNFVRFLAVSNMRNGKFNIMYYPTVEGTHFLRVYLNSVPVGNSPCEIRVVNNPYEPRNLSILTIGGDNDELNRPWGICADFEGRIIVTDRGHNCIKIYDENGSFLFSFGKEGCEPGEFSKPAGVAVDRSLRRIIVADKDNNRVQVFGYDGNFIFEFGRKGEKNGLFLYPWDVTVSPTSLIAVSDSKNRRVQIFDSHGNFVRKFSFNAKKFRGIELPRGVAFKSDGSLMITDFNKHKIIILDDRFQTVKELGSEGTDINEFFRPQSVDVDEKGYFAVSDCKNHRVQVFSPNGNLYKVIGAFGKEPGEMDTPQGIAFLPNGRIGVVELGNNRVQIFQIKWEQFFEEKY